MAFHKTPLWVLNNSGIVQTASPNFLLMAFEILQVLQGTRSSSLVKKSFAGSSGGERTFIWNDNLFQGFSFFVRGSFEGGEIPPPTFYRGEGGGINKRCFWRKEVASGAKGECLSFRMKNVKGGKGKKERGRDRAKKFLRSYIWCIVLNLHSLWALANCKGI